MSRSPLRARSQISWCWDALVVVIPACYETLEFWIEYSYLLGMNMCVALFGLAVPYWLGLNILFLSWWRVACRSLNTHRFRSGSPDLSRRFGPAVGPCYGSGWGRVQLDEDEPHFIVVDLLIVGYLIEELIAFRLVCPIMLILRASFFGSHQWVTRMIG
jgi:hypothetical protein